MKSINSLNSYEFEDIEVYRLILNGTLRTYPIGFWDGINGMISAKKILKYVFEKKLQWSLEDIKVKATRSIFEEYKLDRMLSNVFDGSSLIAIGETYPELKEWADEQYQKHDQVEFEHRRYLDEELIEFLQEKAKELNKIPRANDMHRPSGIVYSNRFGSWEKSLIKAGLIEDIYKDIDFQKYSKDDIIERLKEISIRKERILEKEEIYNIYPEGLIKEFFGSYLMLKKILTNDYTKEELVDVILKKKERLGRLPTNKDIKFPQPIVFIDKFGSWQELIDIVDNIDQSPFPLP